jgi:hypothetical protein
MPPPRDTDLIIQSRAKNLTPPGRAQ